MKKIVSTLSIILVLVFLNFSTLAEAQTNNRPAGQPATSQLHTLNIGLGTEVKLEGEVVSVSQSSNQTPSSLIVASHLGNWVVDFNNSLTKLRPTKIEKSDESPATLVNDFKPGDHIMVEGILLNVNGRSIAPTLIRNNSIPTQDFPVRELGIQFKVPQAIRDLSYTVTTTNLGNQEITAAGFSSQSLIDKDKEKGGSSCESSGTPLGALVKSTRLVGVDGNPRPMTPRDKRVGNFFITYVGPQAACSEDEEVINLTLRQIALLSGDAYRSIETLQEQNPQNP